MVIVYCFYTHYPRSIIFQGLEYIYFIFRQIRVKVDYLRLQEGTFDEGRMKEGIDIDIDEQNRSGNPFTGTRPGNR